MKTTVSVSKIKINLYAYSNCSIKTRDLAPAKMQGNTIISRSDYDA
jgi:hypothetical protein